MHISSSRRRSGSRHSRAFGAPSCLDPGLRRDDQVLSRAKFRASDRPIFSTPTRFLRHFPRTAMSGREDPSACLVLSLQIGALASQGRRRRRARTPRFPIPAQAGWLLHKARRERNAIYRACYGRAAVRNMLQRQTPNNPLSFIILRTFLLTNSSSGTTRPNRSHCVDENVRWALEGRLLTYLPEAAGRHHPHASCILAASGLLQVNVPCPVLPSLLPRLNAEPVAR